MDDYFEGTVRQLLARARHLTERVPPSLPPGFAPLLASCQSEINRIGADLQALVDDPAFLHPANRPARLRSLRRSVADLDLVETLGIAALERSNEDDLRLNDLLTRICREIRYPLPPPVVTTLSQAYFRVIPTLNLLCVPLSEGRFLLHLPDLFHEIAHPPLVAPPSPQVRPLQNALAHALLAALDYLESEVRDQGRRRGPAQTMFTRGAWGTELHDFSLAVVVFSFITRLYFPWTRLFTSPLRGRGFGHSDEARINSPSDTGGTNRHALEVALDMAG
jgi:hypothetical protein